MHNLNAQSIVQIWERGLNRHPLDRALIMLAAACPERPWQELARLPIGQRDRLLFAVRAQLFGPTLPGFADCPACTAPLEFTLNSDELIRNESDFAEAEQQLTLDGYDVAWRAPGSRDLAAITQHADVDDARLALIERCVLDARQHGEPLAACALPDALIAAIGSALAAQDAQAVIDLNLVCPACGHSWQALLDIAAFLWTEISAAARRLLYDVDALARAYGWHEADILAMSSARRELYLEMAHG